MEILDIVNEQDEVIGKADRKKVEEKGLLYRTAEIYVFIDGKILIQKRGPKKTKRPLHYSVVGETVKSGETYEEAAVRGVKEETNLEAKNLKELGKMIVFDKKYNDNFIMKVFRCNGAGKIKLQESEVKEAKTMGKKELEAIIKGKKATPALIASYSMFKGKLK